MTSPSARPARPAGRALRGAVLLGLGVLGTTGALVGPGAALAQTPLGETALAAAPAGSGAGSLAAAASQRDTVSGAAMPTAESNSSRWRLAFSDNFGGSSIARKQWSVYNGAAHGNGSWLARNAVVGGGTLALRARRGNSGHYLTAGVSSGRAVTQTYGKYLVRARFQKGHGIRAVMLLWPKKGWPPEVDFYETTGRDSGRTMNIVTNHWKPRNQMEHALYHSDFSNWHTIGLEWTPGSLKYTLDGQVRAVMTRHVPHQPMWLGMQTAPGSCRAHACPNGSTPRSLDLDIDWVAVYSYHR